MRGIGIALAIILSAAPAVAGPARSGMAATARSVMTTVAVRETTLDRTAQAVSLKAATKALDTIVAAVGPGAPVRRIDLSVTKVQLDPLSDTMRVVVEVRIAVSDAQGKLLCVLAGGAAAEPPTTTYHAKDLPQMREDAVAGAVDGMRSKILLALRTQ